MCGRCRLMAELGELARQFELDAARANAKVFIFLLRTYREYQQHR